MRFLKRLVQQLLPKESIPTDERRESVRLNFRVDIKVQVGDDVYPATVVNLTFTGLCLELDRPLEKDSDLTLLCEDFGPSFNGTVLWAKALKSGTHLVGVECELDEDRLIGSWLEPALIQAGFEAEYVDERRRLVRVPGRVKCELRTLEGELYGEASMLDLSLGGALVDCAVELPTSVSLKFQTFPYGDLPALRGVAKVASVRPTESGTWLCGLRFAESSNRDVELYMAAMLGSKKSSGHNSDGTPASGGELPD